MAPGSRRTSDSAVTAALERGAKRFLLLYLLWGFMAAFAEHFSSMM